MVPDTHPVSGLASDDQNFTVQVYAGDHNLRNKRLEIQKERLQEEDIVSSLKMIRALME